MAESDGPTRLSLGDGELPPVDGLGLRWEGWLVTTSGQIAFVSAEDEVLIERRAGGCVHLEVWSNAESEPDAVCVLLTEPMEDAQGEPVPSPRNPRRAQRRRTLELSQRIHPLGQRRRHHHQPTT